MALRRLGPPEPPMPVIRVDRIRKNRIAAATPLNTLPCQVAAKHAEAVACLPVAIATTSIKKQPNT